MSNVIFNSLSLTHDSFVGNCSTEPYTKITVHLNTNDSIWIFFFIALDRLFVCCCIHLHDDKFTTTKTTTTTTIRVLKSH